MVSSCRQTCLGIESLEYRILLAWCLNGRVYSVDTFEVYALFVVTHMYDVQIFQTPQNLSE